MPNTPADKIKVRQGQRARGYACMYVRINVQCMAPHRMYVCMLVFVHVCVGRPNGYVCGHVCVGYVCMYDLKVRKSKTCFGDRAFSVP